MHLPHEAVCRDGLLALFVNLVAKGYRYYFTGTVKKERHLMRSTSG